MKVEDWKNKKNVYEESMWNQKNDNKISIFEDKIKKVEIDERKEYKFE